MSRHGSRALGPDRLPHLADAEARDERDLAVDDDELPVIAAHPAERARNPGGLNTRTSPPAATSGRNSPRAGPVPQPNQSYITRTATPSRAFAASRSTKRRPTAIAVEDVHLDVNRVAALARIACFPGGVVLGGVAQHAHGVAADERCAGRPAEDLVGDRPQRLGITRQCSRARYP